MKSEKTLYATGTNVRGRSVDGISISELSHVIISAAINVAARAIAL